MAAELELSWSMKVYNGLGKDIEKLMHKFVEAGSIRYEGFVRSWQEMNFTLVYCGLKSLENMREFMEEAFRLSSLYLSPPFDFQQRTGGLYIIYAFYLTQRHRPRIKVRLSCQQWKDLMDMEAELKKQGHLDAYYILLKLKMHKAFCLAYSSQQFIFKHAVSEDNQDKWLAENQREIEQAFPESLLRKLHETHHKYQHLKNQLGVGEERNLKHVEHSMAEVIANRFQEIEENLAANTPSEPQRTNRVSAIKEKSFLRGVESDEQITSPSGNTTSSGSDHPNSPNSKRRNRRPRRPRPPPPDTRPIVERLMPVLKEYRLSDSEEEEEKETVADTTTVGERLKQPVASQTESLTKASNCSPTKRKRRLEKTPMRGSPKKPRKGMSSPASPGPVVPIKERQKKPSPKKKKETKLATEDGQGTPKKLQEKEAESHSPMKGKTTLKGAMRSRPSKGAKVSPDLGSPSPTKRKTTPKGAKRSCPSRGAKPEVQTPSPTKRKTTPKGAKGSCPSRGAKAGFSKKMAKITPLNK